MQRLLEIIFGLLGVAMIVAGVVTDDHAEVAGGIGFLAYSKASGILADNRNLDH